jgi:hypothetical protein
MLTHMKRLCVLAIAAVTLTGAMALTPASASLDDVKSGRSTELTATDAQPKGLGP